jgi:hypothetical protein
MNAQCDKCGTAVCHQEDKCRVTFPGPAGREPTVICMECVDEVHKKLRPVRHRSYT